MDRVEPQAWSKVSVHTLQSRLNYKSWNKNTGTLYLSYSTAPLSSVPIIYKTTDCFIPSNWKPLYVHLYKSVVVQLVKNPLAMQETLVWFPGWEDPWRRDRLSTPVFLGFPCGSAGKESACNSGDLGLIPRLGWSLGEGNRHPVQYSGLENSRDCIVHGVAISQIRQSDFHFSLYK